MTLQDKLLTYYGLREDPAAGAHNPAILEFFHNIGHQWVDTDETAWCSAFMNHCAKELGLPYSGKLNARSWLDVGTPYTPPEDGVSWADNVVAVHWRGPKEGWKGHISVPIVKYDDHIWVLGGNQSDMVRISAYPIAGKNGGILEYRQL